MKGGLEKDKQGLSHCRGHLADVFGFYPFDGGKPLKHFTKGFPWYYTSRPSLDRSIKRVFEKTDQEAGI